MTIGIILIICGFTLCAFPGVGIIGLILIIYGIYRSLKGLKKFIFELIDHIKGTDRPDYRDEARRACGTSGSKQRKETKPPWEE